MAQPNQTVSTTSLLQENRTFPPSPEVVKRAHINAEQYKTMYERSIKDPDGFWLEHCKILDWFKQPTLGRRYEWNTAARIIKHTWFEDGQLNASYNCLDRHLKTPVRDKVAIIWQGEPEDDVRKITYAQLHQEVCKFANVLKSLGIKKGDRVAIYLPM
ncbi:MAG: acetyl-coenzyme A synthetase N-terminal domain-containing protein, partial [Verrucomicrobiia bacterium]